MSMGSAESPSLVGSALAVLEELRKGVAEAQAAAAAKASPGSEDEESKLLYAPHYDGSFKSPVVAEDGSVSEKVVINPFTAGRTLSDKATYGDMPIIDSDRISDWAACL